jgi:hypothetical protein
MDPLPPLTFPSPSPPATSQVKVANVLLKSCSSDVRGFTCKLSDFGLVNLLRSEEEEADGAEEGQLAQGGKPWMRNADAAGTVSRAYRAAGAAAQGRRRARNPGGGWVGGWVR